MDAKRLQQIKKNTKNNLENELIKKRLLEDSVLQLNHLLTEMNNELKSEQKFVSNDSVSQIGDDEYYNLFDARKNAIKLEISARKSAIIISNHQISELNRELQNCEEQLGGNKKRKANENKPNLTEQKSDSKYRKQANDNS
jgi:hypothetical protein